jgi:ribonuclease P protein component
LSGGGSPGSGCASRSENRIPRRAVVLTNRSDFEAVLRSGCRLASRNFVLRAWPNAVAHARLGIIAARKAAARAVDRNRGKRLIREAFRSAFPIIGAYDVTVQLRNNLRDESGAALRAELGALLEGFVRRCADPAQPEK